MTTADSNLNAILSRWIRPAVADQAEVDCAACARPAKCCDFQPFVANFLLGAMLEGGAALPEGDVHFTALGLIPTAAFRARHAQMSQADRGHELRCVFLGSQGRCTVWAWRPGECSTYLCSPPPAVRTRLSARAFMVETAVAQMALAFQGYSRAQIAREIDFLNSPEQGFVPRPPVEFYRRTWAWASRLTADEVRSWLLEDNFELG